MSDDEPIVLDPATVTAEVNYEWRGGVRVPTLAVYSGQVTVEIPGDRVHAADAARQVAEAASEMYLVLTGCDIQSRNSGGGERDDEPRQRQW